MKLFRIEFVFGYAEMRFIDFLTCYNFFVKAGRKDDIIKIYQLEEN